MWCPWWCRTRNGGASGSCWSCAVAVQQVRGGGSCGKPCVRPCVSRGVAVSFGRV